jgi:glycosyltransferase involved in cell wall biosynthesis
MNSSVKPLIVSLGLYRSSGGPVKTISKFRDALKADLYSFVNDRQYRTEDFAVEGGHIIPSRSLPLFREMCIPARDSLAELENSAMYTPIISSHSFYRYHSIWTHQAFKRWKTPYWHVPHGILDPYVTTYGVAMKKMFLKVGGESFLRDAVCTVFATKREWEKAESVFGPMRGEVVHWPVDLVDLSGREERRRKTRRGLGIPEDATVLLYFGRVQGMKRPLETIEAVARVKSDMLHLIMVGPLEGITEGELLNQAQAQGLQNFHYAGGIYGEVKYDYLLAADAYVSFSIRENFNHTAAESMSAALPLILSQGNDLGPIVEESGAGWYLKEDSVDALGSAIEGLMGTAEDELEKMGDSGRRLVANQFSFDYFRSRLLNLAKSYGRV